MHYYILFKNHTDSTAMYSALKKEGFNVRISPTPRELSVCCGVSLLILEEEVAAIKESISTLNLSYIKNEGLDNTFDNERGKYC